MALNLGFVTQSNYFATNFQLVKYSVGGYDSNDEPIEGSTTTFNLIGSVSPFSKGQMRQNSEAGERSLRQIKISCNRAQLIRSLYIGLPSNGDKIIYSGFTYEITAVEDWEEHNIIDVYADIENLTGD